MTTFLEIMIAILAVAIWLWVGILAMIAVDSGKWIMKWLQDAPDQAWANLIFLFWPVIVWSYFYGGIAKRRKHHPTYKPATKRLIDYLFPVRYVEEPVMNDFFKGLKVADVHLGFDFLDRLRILFSGRMHVTMYMLTPEPVERMLTAGGAYIMKPKMFEPKPKKTVNGKLRAAVAGAFSKWRR